ncbi:hypothetical protein [Bradyrhizobium canariense]|uniref:hypothetical protein n=1 Tax=Bradyrhizobium canariense TaxID=255045 RepID=UPI000A194649|nr:hypothetical protein [Bradyrhizobium canariense]OSI52480.1 hypothetical protein BSZ20_03900 [Bradyrhizobium canariense]OSI56500.1 hypothetical protein BST67_03390 [Bradyrhizobium canariense]
MKREVPAKREEATATILSRADLNEAEPTKMIANEAILGGPNVAPRDRTDRPEPSLFDQVLKDALLQASAEHAARHDPAVDLSNLTGLTAYNGRNHSVVAEILKPGLYRKDVWRGFQGSDFGISVAVGGQVRLI